MDTTDIEIVRMLQRDGRLSHEQIAKDVHLSRPAVHERIKRLEHDGVIRGYSARVDWDAIGLPLTAFIWIRTTPSCVTVGRRILQLTTSAVVVEECYRVAGEWCLHVKTHSASSLALQDLLDQICTIPGVQNTMTTVAFSTIGPVATVDDCVVTSAGSDSVIDRQALVGASRGEVKR